MKKPPVNQTRPRIGEMLVKEGLITQAQLEEALLLQQKRGGKTVQNLILLGHLDRQSFLRFLSHQPGMASIDLMNYAIPREVISLIPAEFAVEHDIFPIDKMGNYLTVAMACPLDQESIKELMAVSGLKVRALLVDMEDIESALKRYYPKEKAAKEKGGETPQAIEMRVEEFAGLPPEMPRVATAMAMDGVVRLVSEIESLPALPATVVQIRRSMENPDTRTEDVVRIIERDPGLAAKTIGLANSAAYAIRHKIDSVHMAATMLGLREIFSLVLSTAVIQQFSGRPHGFDHEAYWKRSMYCGTACKIIESRRGRRGGAAVFAAGLLHNIGQLAFAVSVPERYAQVDNAQSDEEIIAQETSLFGIGHSEAGYILAEAWGLPEEISHPIRFHHNLALAPGLHDLVATVALASALADNWAGVQKTDQVSENTRAALAQIRLDPSECASIAAETAERCAAEAI